MKKLLILLIAVSTIACKTESKVDYAIISGNIQNNLGAESAGIYAMDRTLIKTLKINDTGDFQDTLKIKMNNYILYDGANPILIYLDSTFNLSINYDLNKLDESLVISGKGSEVSNYLINKKTIELKHLKGSTEFYKTEEPEYKELFNKIADEQINLLNTTAKLTDKYIEQEEKNINYFYLSMLADYEPAHKYFTRNPNFKASESFLTELEVIDYDNYKDYKFSQYYKRLVNHHYNKKAGEIANKKQMSSGGLALVEAITDVSNQELKNELLFDYANTNLVKERKPEVFYNSFIKNSTNEDQKTKITKIYKRLTATNIGSPSPKFVNYENNAGGTTSLDDLKGKYVYIDVWATWCGPCIKEIPALKVLEKEFHGKNIEFVSLSIDKKRDHAKWKKMIVDKELKGIQLIADNEWQSSFVQDYSIKGIPRFILLDPNGNIVNANAPRPSNPALKTLFNSLEM